MTEKELTELVAFLRAEPVTEKQWDTESVLREIARGRTRPDDLVTPEEAREIFRRWDEVDSRDEEPTDEELDILDMGGSDSTEGTITGKDGASQ